MPIRKIEKILNALGYEEDAVIMFTLRRFERLNKHHIKLNISNEKIQDVFEKFHERFGVKIHDNEFPSSSGNLKIRHFIEFLEAYDEKFDLNWCEIDLKELIIRPRYL